MSQTGNPASLTPGALNDQAAARCDQLIAEARWLRIAVRTLAGGARLIDCGAGAIGGLESGRRLAEICTAALAEVQIVPGDSTVWPGPAVCVRTDQPVLACLAAQYAGWPLKLGDFFAMGSGPMRAARGREPLLEQLGLIERPQQVVGVLETDRLPSPDVVEHVAEQCGVEPAGVTLLVAPTTSLAGTVQVVSRSIETALHKLHELKFDIWQVTSGVGIAPLPPPAADPIAAIGRTNDAVLYGARVTLWLRTTDEQLARIGPQVPSCASSDFGRPFVDIFQRYNRDFYQIDPLLFSPAEVTFINLTTGRTFRFGEPRPDLLRQSFGL